MPHTKIVKTTSSFAAFVRFLFLRNRICKDNKLKTIVFLRTCATKHKYLKQNNKIRTAPRCLNSNETAQGYVFSRTSLCQKERTTQTKHGPSAFILIFSLIVC
uniref:Uncharacterized protein n=1 Tax=Ixodes ricinus TaxID=34613 RepID=A0A6B0UCQ9_IXORI